MPIAIEKPNVVLVEGKDEEHFFAALLKHMMVKDLQVIGIGGKTTLGQNLKALKLSPRFTEVLSLGIIRDANDDAGGAFKSVRHALGDARLPAPQRPGETAAGPPHVMVMILPGSDKPGMLEDLCIEAVERQPAMKCVAQYFECLGQKGLLLPRNLSKAKVQVFLASKEEPDKRLGEAGEAGYWPFHEGPFRALADFLRHLVA